MSLPASGRSLTWIHCSFTQQGTASKDPWPPCSPDLSLHDIYLRDLLKGKVYCSNHQTPEKLKTSVQQKITDITVAELKSLFPITLQRAEKCIEALLATTSSTFFEELKVLVNVQVQGFYFLKLQILYVYDPDVTHVCSTLLPKKKKELLNWARFMCATLHKVIKSLWRFCWETLIKEKKKWPVSSDLKWLSTFLRVAPLFFFSVVLLFLYARKKNDILNKAIFLIKSRKKKKKN